MPTTKTKVKPITATVQPPVKKRVVKPVAKKLINRVVFVLDSSGSMGWLSHKVVSMYNAWITKLKQEAIEKNQDMYVSRIDFANNARLVSSNVPIAKAELMTSFYTGGGTALFDGLYEGVEDVEEFEGIKNTSMLIIVITDGDENVSKPRNVKDAGSMMLGKMKGDNWTFTFMLPPGRKARFCSQYNVPTDNVMEWEVTERGAAIAEEATSNAIVNYMTSRAAGQTCSRSFYSQTDMSAVKPKDVKSALVDIASQCQVFEVLSECDIGPFVAKKTKKLYHPKDGKAFYQLTKKEEIQPKKEILIMEKGKPQIYGGSDARTMVGLHKNATDHCTPGNHSSFDIFVQSTSVNRKLVRGTKLVVKT